jgi:predicted dehydrogenase
VLLQHGGTRSRVTFDQADQMEEEFDYFANRLQRDLEAYPDGHHGLTDMRAIKALYDSVESGQRETL